VQTKGVKPEVGCTLSFYRNVNKCIVSKHPEISHNDF